MHSFTDPKRGALRVDRLLVSGRSYDVARATRPDGSDVVARAPRFGAGAGPAEHADWRAAMEREVEMASSECARLPRNAALWQVADDDFVVVYDRVDGKRLDAWLADQPDGRADDQAVLSIARDVAEAVADLNERGFIHRHIAPEHVLITPDGRAVLIGLSNGSRKNEPACLAKETGDDAYTAPETHRERGGHFNTPRADVYGFGMFLSYLATGERPTGDVGAPLTRTAFERLESRPDGLALVIAKCTQPLAKNRFPSMGRVRTYLTLEDLPTPRTPGFGPLALLAPWGRGEPTSLRVGHLSPGPLVDRPRAAEPSEPVADVCSDAPDSAPADPATVAETDPLPGSSASGSRTYTAWIMSALIVAIAAWILISSISSGT